METDKTISALMREAWAKTDTPRPRPVLHRPGTGDWGNRMDERLDGNRVRLRPPTVDPQSEPAKKR